MPPDATAVVTSALRSQFPEANPGRAQAREVLRQLQLAGFTVVATSTTRNVPKLPL